MSVALSVEDLGVRYGAVTAVHDVSFTLERGRVLGLVGESGSGKSTTARAIVGLAASTGRITIGDTDLSSVGGRASRRARRRVQMVFQDPRSSLDPRFTVAQCISEGLGGRTGRGTSTRVTELLELVSLDPGLARSRPAQLSGGQRQRVAIARALAAEPEVLIADEVTASLDVSVQAVVLNLLRHLQAELGLSMLFISHNLAVVRYMCDDVAVMFGGHVVEDGAVEDVIRGSVTPVHPVAARGRAGDRGPATVVRCSDRGEPGHGPRPRPRLRVPAAVPARARGP